MANPTNDVNTTQLHYILKRRSLQKHTIGKTCFNIAHMVDRLVTLQYFKNNLVIINHHIQTMKKKKEKKKERKKKRTHTQTHTHRENQQQ